MTDPLHTLTENKSLWDRVRSVLSSACVHIELLAQLAQIESKELGTRLIKKVVLLALAAIFFFIFYLLLNWGIIAYFNASLLSILGVAGFNLILTGVLAYTGLKIQITPVYSDTSEEIKTSFLWLKEKLETKNKSDKN